MRHSVSRGDDGRQPSRAVRRDRTPLAAIAVGERMRNCEATGLSSTSRSLACEEAMCASNRSQVDATSAFVSEQQSTGSPIPTWPRSRTSPMSSVRTMLLSYDKSVGTVESNGNRRGSLVRSVRETLGSGTSAGSSKSMSCGRHGGHVYSQTAIPSGNVSSGSRSAGLMRSVVGDVRLVSMPDDQAMEPWLQFETGEMTELILLIVL